MTLPKDTLASSGKTLGQVLKSGKKQHEEQLKSRLQWFNHTTTISI